MGFWVGLLVVIVIIFAIEWVANLTMGRQLRSMAKSMAEYAAQESEIFTEIDLLVEDLRRIDPERDEILELAHLTLLSKRDSLDDLRQAMLLQSKSLPSLWEFARLLPIATRAKHRRKDDDQRQQRMRDLGVIDDGPDEPS